MLLYIVAPQMQFRKDLRKTSYDSFYKVNPSVPFTLFKEKRRHTLCHDRKL